MIQTNRKDYKIYIFKLTRLIISEGKCFGLTIPWRLIIQFIKRLMIQIAQIPYRKIYSFPILSDAMALVSVIFVAIVLFSFFMVYSVNNFYLSSIDEVEANPPITYNYHYHLTIQTSSSIYVYTTLFQQSSAKPFTFSYLYNDEQLLHQFQLKWAKPVTERVTKASLLIFMVYSTSEVTDAIGMVSVQGKGLSMADLSIVGTITLEDGQDQATPPPTTNILPDNDYDVQETFLSLERDYSTFLSLTSSQIATNMPTNVFRMNARIKSQTDSLRPVAPSILGQLVWSWSQFFPVAFVLYLIGDYTIRFLFRENLIKRALQHESRIMIW